MNHDGNTSLRCLTGILLSAFVCLSIAVHGSARAQNQDFEETRELTEVDEVDDRLRVKIADPFIELHTGPGSGYPIFYVIDRGTEVRILRRKTDWFRIETDDGKSGWASRSQMQRTLLPSGERLPITDNTEDDFVVRDWVVGFTGGEFESAPVFTLFGAYSFTENLAGEVHYGQSIGDDSNATFWKLNLVMQPLPDLKYSPYLTLGVGRIDVEPSATLIAPDDDENELAQVGVGIQRYVSRSFMFRAEVNEYVIFSSTTANDDNEEVFEWKLGFAVFF